MGMTIDKAIEIINHYLDYPKEEVREALFLSIDTMRKYKKIEQILQEQCIIPEGCYPKLKKIKEVVEDGNL